MAFPSKICSRAVDLMEKKHLIRGLIGNYGYVKAPAPAGQSLPTMEAPSDSDDSRNEGCTDSTTAFPERINDSYGSAVCLSQQYLLIPVANLH